FTYNYPVRFYSLLSLSSFYLFMLQTNPVVLSVTGCPTQRKPSPCSSMCSSMCSLVCRGCCDDGLSNRRLSFASNHLDHHRIILQTIPWSDPSVKTSLVLNLFFLSCSFQVSRLE